MNFKMKKLIVSIKIYWADHCWFCHAKKDPNYSVCLRCWRQGKMVS